MIKSELVQRMASRNPHLYHRDLERIVNSVFDEITVALHRGDRVELRGFGVFLTKRRPARTGRNPRNGAQIQVSAKAIPAFKTARRCTSVSSRLAMPRRMRRARRQCHFLKARTDARPTR